jgi:hypothetical protein
VKMLRPGAAMASGVGTILALVYTARKHHAEVYWAAQVVGLSVQVQHWLENEGPTNGAPVLAAITVLLVAVSETVGTHRRT